MERRKYREKKKQNEKDDEEGDIEDEKIKRKEDFIHQTISTEFREIKLPFRMDRKSFLLYNAWRHTGMCVCV